MSGPTKRKVANLLGLAVLAYLVQRPMHPYELSKTLQSNGDARSIHFTHGSLYMVIKQLDRAGFVEPVGSGREGQRPERTVFALTEAGRAELHDWLRELVSQPRHEHPGFVAALSLIGALTPGDAVALLRERLAGLEQALTESRGLVAQALADGVHPLFLIEEEYRQSQLIAEVGFVERLLHDITDPDDGWAPAWQGFHDQLSTKDQES